MFSVARLLEDYENKHDSTPDTASDWTFFAISLKKMESYKPNWPESSTSGSAVSMLLNGERPITAEHARRMGKRFGVNPGAFL